MKGPIELVMAAVVFGLGFFGVGCLMITTFFLYKRVRSSPDAALLRDTMAVNICAGFCLLIECATLLWDSLSPHQFPLIVRWAVLIVCVPIMSNAALRLLRYYVAAARSPNV